MIKLQGPDAPVLDFMGWRRVAAVVSLVIMVVSIGSLAVRGLNLGLDFTGGTLIEVGYAEAVPLSKVRATLQQGRLDDVVVQHFGAAGDVLIRIAPEEGRAQAQLGDKVMKLLRDADGAEVELRRIEFVGPQVGDELRDQGGMGLLLALGMIMVYVAFRFQFKFAVGAVAALVHDVVAVLGFFSLTGAQFDLTVLAAILAVIGYSLNDTIVVSDRIRENFRRMRRSQPLTVINSSLTQVLARTLVTSFTTLLVLVAMFLMGGEQVRGFSLALIVGVFLGTYSSIYVAANILVLMDISRDDLILPESTTKDALMP